MNRSILFGNITKDLEVTNKVCRFNLATNEKYRDRDGKTQEKTNFHPCIAFGKQAEMISMYAAKGSKILIEGKLTSSKYESNGQTKYDYRTVVDRFYLTPSQSSQAFQRPQQAACPPPVQQGNFQDDDLPF